MENIPSQLGAIVLHLWQIRLDKIGSLFQGGNDGFAVGECLSPSLAWQHRDSLEGIDRGPFSDEHAYINALISAYVSHAEELPLAPHALFAPVPDISEYPCWASYKTAVNRWNDFVSIGQKIEHSNNRFAYCIAGQLMREMSLHLYSGTGSMGFPLSHPDLHTGNIFVDDDSNITCVIDWASTTSVLPTEVLATSGLQGLVSPPGPSLIVAFRAGFERASCRAQLHELG